MNSESRNRKGVARAGIRLVIACLILGLGAQEVQAGVVLTAEGGGNADPCTNMTTQKLFVPISQTTGTQLLTGTTSMRTYVCAIHIVTATAQNIALVSGTGTVCATSLGAMAGGTTAATGWNLAANGGLVLGNGGATVAKSDTDADNVCLLQSSTGQISGTLSYVAQ
jgi:hypothetical protein